MYIVLKVFLKLVIHRFQNSRSLVSNHVYSLPTDVKNELETITYPPQDEYGFVIPAVFKHHSYVELEKQLQLLASNYPNFTRLYSIGKSVEGRNLYVMEISDNPGKHELGKFPVPSLYIWLVTYKFFRKL